MVNSAHSKNSRSVMLLLPQLLRFATLMLGVAENISDKDRNAGSRDHNGRLQPFAHLCIL
jgi:hypothetical protein